MDEARDVRDFWFGPLPATAASLDERMALWFDTGAGPARQEHDREIARRFTTLFERAAAGELAAWADSPRRRLSLILLLDQFPRHLFRGTARAFATDAQALALSLSGMQSAADAALQVPERLFFYMPLQHAESREAQEESVAAYRRLAAEAPRTLGDACDAALRSAVEHRDVIGRFGRFPHRNRALGRDSTPAERAWLAAAESTFGQ